MSTKKKAAHPTAASSKTAAPASVPHKNPPHSQAYEEAVREYGSAIDLLHKGDYPAAHERFKKLVAEHRHEPELAERARTYSRICVQRLSGPARQPDSSDECYHTAVFLTNSGQWDKAIELLDISLKTEPTSVRSLYARACAWALKGNAAKTLADLRQAIAIDPKVRFQAANDPDFEKIREEPAFIDIIEPTPAGA